MKTFKKVVATALIASMALSATGCGALKFKATDAKTFKKALEKANDGMSEALDDFDDEWGYGFSDDYTCYYVEVDDADEIEDYYDAEGAEKFYMAMTQEDEDDEEGVIYYFIEFEDEEAARDYFNEEYYEDFVEAKDDKDIDGDFKSNLGKTSGYIIIDAESSNKKIGKGQVTGGIYLADNTVVVVLAFDASKSAKKEITAFLEAIEYPFL